MLEDIEYVAETSTAQKSALWYTRLWRACLCCGCLSNKKKKPQDHLIGYNPVGPLQRAAGTGDFETLQQLLSGRYFHVDECDRKNRTSLHYACANNQVDAVTLLLDYDCSINIQDDEGCTPLIKAVQEDNLECTCVMLWVGADPHVQDFSGHAALHHAVLRGNTTTVEKLLEFNADIEAETEYGLTPIQLAISENDHQMAEFLTSKGANAHSVADPNSKGTQAEDLEEKHVRFSKVVEIYYCTEERPSGRGMGPTRPLKSILKISSQISTAGETDRTSLWLDDKPIPDIPGSPIQGDASISVTKGLYCRIKERARAQAVVRKSQLNAHSSGEPIPDPWEEETPLTADKKKKVKFPYALSAQSDTVPTPSACAGDTGDIDEENDFVATHDTNMDVTFPTAACNEDAIGAPHVPCAHSNLVRLPTTQIWPIPSACAGDTGDIDEENDFGAMHDTNMDVTPPTAARNEDAIGAPHVPCAHSNLVQWPTTQIWPNPAACAGDTGDIDEENGFGATHDSPPTAACNEDAIGAPHVPYARSNLVRWPTTQFWPIPSACAGDTGDIDEENDFGATHDTNMDVTLPTAACPEDATPTKHADSQPDAGQCTDDEDLALKAYRAEEKHDQFTTYQRSALDHDAEESLDPAQEDQFLLHAAHPSDHTDTTRDIKIKPVPFLEPQMQLFLVVLLLWLLTFLFLVARMINRIGQVQNGENYQRAPSNKKDEQVAPAPAH